MTQYLPAAIDPATGDLQPAEHDTALGSLPLYPTAAAARRAIVAAALSGRYRPLEVREPGARTETPDDAVRRADALSDLLGRVLFAFGERAVPGKGHGQLRREAIVAEGTYQRWMVELERISEEAA